MGARGETGKAWGLKGGDLIEWLLVLEGSYDRALRTVDTKQDGSGVICISGKRPLRASVCPLAPKASLQIHLVKIISIYLM